MSVWESAPLDVYHTTRVTPPELTQNELDCERLWRRLCFLCTMQALEDLAREALLTKRIASQTGIDRKVPTKVPSKVPS